jgi:hypothetical protein
MMGFAHTKDMMQGEISRELVTRKKVSVSAYAHVFCAKVTQYQLLQKLPTLLTIRLPKSYASVD